MAEEHADRAGASGQELALLESNAGARSQAILGYYAKLEGSFNAAVDTEAAARSKRSRLAASAAAAAVMAAEDSAAAASSSAAVGQQQAGHHQHRLWVKDRSRAWWDKCSSPDYPEEDFRCALRMGAVRDAAASHGGAPPKVLNSGTRGLAAGL